MTVNITVNTEPQVSLQVC